MDERIKTYLRGAIIVALIAFSFSAVRYANSFSRSIDPGSLRSFTVSGEGKVVAVPDIATFTFGVVTQGGTNIATLQEENTTKVNGAIEFVKSEGVAAKDIKTEYFNLEPQYEYFNCREGGPCPPPRIVGYAITEQVSVKVRDFEKIGDLLAGVLQNGANTVSQLQFAIDDPVMVQNQAREEAIQKAKATARSIANAGGFRLGKLISISEGGYYPPIPYYDKFGRGGDAAFPEAAAAPTIEPGSQDVLVNVVLTYEIQ